MKFKNKNSQTFSLAKNSRSKSRKKRVLIGAAVVVIVAVIAGGVFFVQRQNSNSERNKRDDSAQTDSAKKKTSKNTGKNTSANPGKNSASSSTPDSPGSRHADEDANPNPLPSKSVTMAGFSQQNGQVAAAVNVSGGNASSTCVFSFSRQDAKPVVKQTQSDGKTCSTSVPEVEFNPPGIWQLNVSLFNGSSKIAETNQNVTIN